MDLPKELTELRVRCLFEVQSVGVTCDIVDSPSPHLLVEVDTEGKLTTFIWDAVAQCQRSSFVLHYWPVENRSSQTTFPDGRTYWSVGCLGKCLERGEGPVREEREKKAWRHLWI